MKLSLLTPEAPSHSKINRNKHKKGIDMKRSINEMIMIDQTLQQASDLYGLSAFTDATPLNSPCSISRSFRSVSELLLLRRIVLPSSSSPSASSSWVRSSMVFLSFSYAALSSECDTSSLLYLSVNTESCASRSRACFSLRSRNAR
jgi:hypothetical protein